MRVRVEGTEQTDREGPRRAEAGAGRDVGDADDLDAGRNVVAREHLADQGVLDLVDATTRSWIEYLSR